MMKKITILLLCIFGLTISAFAQTTIRLRVLEEQTKLPIVGATLVYASKFEEINSFKNHAIVDANGYATIKPQKSEWCYYRINMMGFLPLEGKIKSTTKELSLYMDVDINQIGEVIVTAEMRKPIKSSPILTQVIDAKALVDAGYSDIQDALMQETPGMNIQKVGFGSEISMQGLDARHILFLMDGERLTGEMAGNLDYERFNIHGIDRIEIVKGSSSTLFGSRASGAVINLITKKTTYPLSIDMGVRYGQMNERNYDDPQPQDFLYMYANNADQPNTQAWVSAGFNAGKFTGQTDVAYSSVDAFFLYQGENDRKVYKAEDNDFLEEDVVFESPIEHPPMGVEGSEHITASQKLYYEPNESLEFQVYGTYFHKNTYDLIEDLYFSQAFDWTGGVKLRYNCKDYFSLMASMHTDYYTRYKRLERQDVRQKVYDSKIYQPRLTLTSKYFEGHDLIMGIDYFQDDLTSDRFVNQKMTTRGLEEVEAFLQDEYTVNPKLSIVAGVRSNYSIHYGIMAMPKLAAKWTPGDRTAYRLNYAMGYRSPSIKELFFNWDHLGMFQIKGDEDLQPEKNQYVSLSAEYSKNDFFMSGTVYRNEFKDKIEGIWRVYDMQYNFEYMNLRTQTLYGLEAMLRWRMTPNFMLNTSYSYVNVSELDGIQVNTSSPHAATASLEYRFRKKNYRMTATFSTSVSGRKVFNVQDRLVVDVPSIDENGNEVILKDVNDAYFRCDLPAYALCNLNVTQEFWNKYKLSVGVDNVFNYKPSVLGSGVTMFNIPATAGARMYVQLSIDIKDVMDAFSQK